MKIQPLFTLMLLFAFLLFACTKTKTAVPYERTDFFRSPSDAAQKVQLALNQLHPNDSLVAIENISYVDTRQQTCAFVYYNGKEQPGNLVFQHKFGNDGSFKGSYVTCSGSNCDCKVRAVFINLGEVNLECSCSTCTMHITPTLNQE